MTEHETEKVKQAIAKQAIPGAIGAGLGALTKKPLTPRPYQRIPVAGQVGSAMGSAARNGAGVKGTLAAGGAVLAAKGAAIAAATVAAAPVVLGVAAVGAACWGVFKIFEKKKS